jgi:hypothetical protein
LSRDIGPLLLCIFKGIEGMIGAELLPGESLLFEKWPKEALEKLLSMVSERYASSFDLSTFRADGSCPIWMRQRVSGH